MSSPWPPPPSGETNPTQSFPTAPTQQFPAYGQQPGPYAPDPFGSYGQPPQPGQFQHQGKPENALGIWALVLGILSVTCFSILAGIPAIVLGVLGRRKVTERRATNGGMATAGIVLGVISFVLLPLLIWLGNSAEPADSTTTDTTATTPAATTSAPSSSAVVAPTTAAATTATTPPQTVDTDTAFVTGFRKAYPELAEGRTDKGIANDGDRACDYLAEDGMTAESLQRRMSAALENGTATASAADVNGVVALAVRTKCPESATAQDELDAPVDTKVTIPKVKGVNGAIIAEKLDDLGITNYSFTAGDSEWVLMYSNWVGVSIEPAPGTKVDPADKVIVTVKRPG